MCPRGWTKPSCCTAPPGCYLSISGWSQQRGVSPPPSCSKQGDDGMFQLSVLRSGVCSKKEIHEVSTCVRYLQHQSGSLLCVFAPNVSMARANVTLEIGEEPDMCSAIIVSPTHQHYIARPSPADPIVYCEKGGIARRGRGRGVFGRPWRGGD